MRDNTPNPQESGPFTSSSYHFRPLERQDRLHPKSVSNINSTKITDKEISLIWDPPAGDFDAFEVQYLDATGRLIQVGIT